MTPPNENQNIIIPFADLVRLTRHAVSNGVELALERLAEEQLLDKRAAGKLCGIKSYTTFKKLSSTPGFPLSIGGKFRRAEIETWLKTRGGAK